MSRQCTDIVSRPSRKPLFILIVILVQTLMGCGSWRDRGDWLQCKRLYEERCTAFHGQRGSVNGERLFEPPSDDLTSLSAQPKLDAELQETMHERRHNAVIGRWKLVRSGDEIYEALASVGSLSR
jgi:hypothetical protein